MSGTKPALQERSRKTQAAIVDALERLLRHKSFEEVSVAEIAREAGISVGAVYRRFENKDALIPVLFDLYRARVTEKQKDLEENPPQPEDLRSALRLSMEMSWQSFCDDGHLLRACHLYSRIRPDLVGEEWTPMLEASRASVRAVLSHFDSELAVPNDDRAVDAVTYFMNVILIEEGLYEDVGPPVTWSLRGEELAREMADFAWGYLTRKRP